MYVELSNVTGQKVMSLDQGILASGAHFVKLDVSTLESGVYFYTVTAGADKVTKSMIVE